MLALALTAVSAVADDDLPPLTLLEYDLLISGHDYSAEVAAAYSKDGLGILAVVGAPNSTIESPRRRLLQLAHTLATSPSEKLAAYERPELSYASGWSLGRETFKGKPDMSKGSWYAHALEDDPGADGFVASTYASALRSTCADRSYSPRESSLKAASKSSPTSALGQMFVGGSRG